MRIGTWNVLSLYQSGALKKLLSQLDLYNTDITALQEIRWTSEGIIDKENHTIFYSCDKTRHVFGTGFIENKRIKHLVTDFKAKTPRICKLRVGGLFFNYSLICVHAPTEEKDDDEKDNFYEDLDQIYEECPKRDVKIILGDLNAKIGQEEVYRPIIGKYSLHTLSNDNGIRLTDFTSSKNMVVASTLFNHKDIHKMTCRSPDWRTYNQIDHLLIDARHVSNVMDVRTFRGANIDSDQYLLISKIRSRISNARKMYGSCARKFNSEKLKISEISSAYREQLNEYLAKHVDNDNDDINGAWMLLKNAITQTADAVLDRMERVTYTDWFAAECEQATTRKNLTYKRMQQRNHTRKAVEEYRTATKEEKRVQKQKKKIFIEHELKELERLRSNNESKSFFQKLNKSRKDFQPRTTLCRNEERMLLSEEDDILRRWAEYFDKLLNAELSNQRTTNQETHQVFSATDEPIPTLDEVNNAIQKLKNNKKKPGMDLIQAELIKKAGPDFIERMHQLIISIWTTEVIPEDWNWSIICPIHKKGDVTACSNYRGISLLCVAYKIFSNILFNRLMPYVEAAIGDYQCGYRQERSTTDQNSAVRQILEKCSEYTKDTHHLFIDFKAAYDSIDRSRLYAAVEELNIPQKLIALVKATMNNTQCRVKIQNRFSAPINTKNGIRQGDALACLLFNVALEKVVRDAALNIRRTIFYKSVQILAYADDIDIIGRTQSAMIEAFNSLEKAARDMNLFINQHKTKYMPVTKRGHAHHPH